MSDEMQNNVCVLGAQGQNEMGENDVIGAIRAGEMRAQVKRRIVVQNSDFIALSIDEDVGSSDVLRLQALLQQACDCLCGRMHKAFDSVRLLCDSLASEYNIDLRARVVATREGYCLVAMRNPLSEPCRIVAVGDDVKVASMKDDNLGLRCLMDRIGNMLAYLMEAFFLIVRDY